MTLGQQIKAARNKAKMRGEDLGALVGLTKGTISKIENDELKNPPDARTLIRISEVLNAPEILLHHCQTCPIRQHIMLRNYPELNNIRNDPASIVSKMQKEMKEALLATDDLAEKYLKIDFKSDPEYRATFVRAMEQILDVERVIEELKFDLVLKQIHTQEELQEVIDNQQQKCIDHGHHKPERSGEDRRTGTEG